MSIEFLDTLPNLIRTGNPRKPDPVVAEFLTAVKENKGKWAAWPLERKTKPQVPEGYEVASREGIFYVSFKGTEETEEN